MSSVDPYLTARLGYPKFAGGLEVRFDCPCDDCKDSRAQGKADPKLYVNFSKGVFHCMRSSWGGPLKELYEYVGVYFNGPEVRVPSNLREAIGATSEPDAVSKGRVDALGSIEVPDCTDFTPTAEATLWLQKRLATVPEFEIADLVSRGVIRRGSGRHWDRVFFVDVYDEKARYWTARTYINGFNPKYLNPYNVPRSKVLGNQNRVEEEYQDEIIICEGPISAIVAGPNAVWTYGRCVTQDQLHLLDSLQCSRFTIVSEPDNDARNDTLELARSLHKFRRDVYIVDMPIEELPDGKKVQHDPASLGRPTFKRLVDETAVQYSWSSEVVRRLSIC